MTLHNLPSAPKKDAPPTGLIVCAVLSLLQFAVLIELAWWWAIIHIVRSL